MEVWRVILSAPSIRAASGFFATKEHKENAFEIYTFSALRGELFLIEGREEPLARPDQRQSQRLLGDLGQAGFSRFAFLCDLL
jgi:hypothetical protein